VRATRGLISPRITLLQSTRLAQHEYINAFGTGAWRETVSSSINSNHDHLYPPDPNDPDPEDESDDESEDESNDDPEPRQPTQAPTQSPAQPAPATPPMPPTTRPSPADTEAALGVARSLFPDRANAAQFQPTAPATNPTPTQTAQPNNAPPVPPPPPQPQRSAPTRDPYEVRFDHTHRLLIDGKPW
jgi:hypothetical protein